MSEYRALTADGWRWRVATAWVASFTTGPFARFGDLLRAGRPVKDLNIKRTVEVRADGRDFLVKIYKRRGALQRLRTALLGSRAGRELEALLGALARGVPTLPFIAIGERKGESCVVVLMERDRERLDRLLASSPRRRALIREYGRWARRVHDAGVAQYDFNPTNVLARPGADPDLRLIDFEKVAVGRPLSETARLKSLAKIFRMIPASRADRLRFWAGYFEPEAADRAGLRRRAERLLEFVRAQKALDARRRREACVREGRNFGKFRRGDAWGWYRRDLIDAGAVAGLVAGGGTWRRVAEDRALDAWRRENGAEEGDLPVAVVVARGSVRGHLVYGPGAP
jgi:tRNA A-37 threonylcarbamoyl transferase component Bud32